MANHWSTRVHACITYICQDVGDDAWLAEAAERGLEEAGEHEDGGHDAGDGHDAGHEVGPLADRGGALGAAAVRHRISDRRAEDGSAGSGQPGLGSARAPAPC